MDSIMPVSCYASQLLKQGALHSLFCFLPYVDIKILRQELDTDTDTEEAQGADKIED